MTVDRNLITRLRQAPRATSVDWIAEQMPAVLDGYEAALEEVDQLTRDLAFHRDGHRAVLAQLDELRSRDELEQRRVETAVASARASIAGLHARIDALVPSKTDVERAAERDRIVAEYRAAHAALHRLRGAITHPDGDPSALAIRASLNAWSEVELALTARTMDAIRALGYEGPL